MRSARPRHRSSLSSSSSSWAAAAAITMPRQWTAKNAVAAVALILLLMILLMLSSSDKHQRRYRWSSSSNSAEHIVPERSFLKSLESFLARPYSPTITPNEKRHYQNFGDGVERAARQLDDAIWATERLRLRQDGQVPVRVYVYDMPSKFTYDLLRLFRDTYRDTANLTSNGSPIHRLIEQHSVDYWLWSDLIAPEKERRIKSAVRVYNQEEADVFYIPFFTTISFFLLEKPKCKQLYREALRWVMEQPAWNRSKGRDHILPVHHPWSFKSVRRFMKTAIWLLPDMDSTGNWYKPGEVSLEKDLILPYVANTNVCDDLCLAKNLPHRKTLLFFRGRLKRNAGGKIRSKLLAVLKDKPNIIIDEGSIGEAGKEAAEMGMRSSMFCLSPAGDTPSSARLFDAIVSGCIPVIVSDELELPFEGILDYRKISLFVSSDDATQPEWLLEYLRSINRKKIDEMQANLAKFSKHFQYSSPAQLLGPEDLTWRTIAGKLSTIKMHIRRSQRMVKNSRSLCTCGCTYSNNTKQTIGSTSS